MGLVCVLVLNQNYVPLNVTNARRAFVLLDRGKAEILEHAEETWRSATRLYPLPSVIRLVYLIKRPQPRPKLTRREVFVRDGFACQYCGKETHELTLDHVIPRHRGGEHDWENLASACKACNHRKANRTPAEARMTLIRPPRAPKKNPYLPFLSYLDAQDGWRKFIPQWELELVAS